MALGKLDQIHLCSAQPILVSRFFVEEVSQNSTRKIFAAISNQTIKYSVTLFLNTL